uniref:BHLH domain-containing protein n=1 Tax=Lactuca sativa TaxID=4236 RepID=A0A9R1XKC4_LACSA|nr:hypothetical protein LSAT_V11C300123800 [Lactuca sativa]
MPPASDLRPAPPHRPTLSSDTQPVDPLLSDTFQRHPPGGVPLLRQRATPPVSSFMRRLRVSPRDFGVPLSNTFAISFGDVKPKNEMLPVDDSLGYEAVGATKIPIISRNPIQAQDHVLAERKRKEKLNRNFISLSSLIPKLKKMDKASVLEDASIYIKEHQDRVKELEGLSGTKRKNVQDCVLHACKVILVTYADNFFSMIPML